MEVWSRRRRPARRRGERTAAGARHRVRRAKRAGRPREHVDQVILDQRKAIRRADDPDPVVYAALERSVLNLPEPGRSPWPVVGLGLAGVGGRGRGRPRPGPGDRPDARTVRLHGRAGGGSAPGRRVRRGAPSGARVRAAGPGADDRPASRPASSRAAPGSPCSPRPRPARTARPSSSVAATRGSSSTSPSAASPATRLRQDGHDRGRRGRGRAPLRGRALRRLRAGTRCAGSWRARPTRRPRHRPASRC